MKENLHFSHLLLMFSFTELHGVTYITGHYTLRPPGTECKQILFYTRNNFLEDICLNNSPRGGAGSDVENLARSLK